MKCDDCGCEIVNEPDWSEEKAREEARANGWDPDDPGMAVVCDECYARIMGRPEVQAEVARNREQKGA